MYQACAQASLTTHYSRLRNRACSDKPYPGLLTALKDVTSHMPPWRRWMAWLQIYYQTFQQSFESLQISMCIIIYKYLSFRNLGLISPQLCQELPPTVRKALVKAHSSRRMKSILAARRGSKTRKQREMRCGPGSKPPKLIPSDISPSPRLCLLTVLQPPISATNQGPSVRIPEPAGNISTPGHIFMLHLGLSLIQQTSVQFASSLAIQENRQRTNRQSL